MFSRWAKPRGILGEFSTQSVSQYTGHMRKSAPVHSGVLHAIVLTQSMNSVEVQ